MEQKSGQPHLDRHVEANNSDGWVMAGATVLLAIILTAGAFYINRTRYHSPNDVLAPTKAAPAAH
jgi:hypothetical protein